MDRRGLITGLIAFAAAPAIVRAESLMPVKGDRYFTWDYTAPIFPDLGGPWERAFNAGISVKEYVKPWVGPNGGFYEGTWTFLCKRGERRSIWSNEEIGFSKQEILKS